MSDSEEDWNEVESDGDVQKCPCPFCEEVHLSTDDTLSHCCSQHDTDLVKQKRKLGLDFYGWIKLINYIRKESPKADSISTTNAPYPWEDDRFLQPVIPDDPLLQLDFDEDEDDNDDMVEGSTKSPIAHQLGNELTLEDLRQRLKETELQLMESENRLKDAYDNMSKMRKAMNELLADGTDKISLPENSRGETNKEGDINKDSEEEIYEDGYFSTYSHFSIHEEMLKDQIRMESYQLFISHNPELFKDKVVLDVGCGTGILSMMAVQSGARRVIAVDQSEIIYKAMVIARENNLSDSITFIRGRVEDVILPVDKVDVIISEWMGYMLLFESMMDTVLYARDKWLKDHTQVYPNNCNLSLVAMGDEYEYQNNVDFWSDIGGFKMSCMRTEGLKEARVMTVDEYSLISSADVVKKFDLSVVQPCDLQFESRFSLTMLQSTKCHAIVSYFDISFEVPTYRVYFSTSPQDTPTHWKQTVFFLKEPIKVQTGDLLRGVFKCSRDRRDHRCMIIQLSMELCSFHKDDLGQPIKPIKLEQSFSLC